MSFEMYEEDLEILFHHAFLAAESGTMSSSHNRKFELEERYIITQLPRLYDYLVVENGKYLIGHGERISNGNRKKHVFNLNLPVEVAEQYYQLQRQYDRSEVLNALLNIYDFRQDVIKSRERSELDGSFHNYRYPFYANDWNYSYLGCPGKRMWKAYQIDLKEPIVLTVQKFLRLEVIND